MKKVIDNMLCNTATAKPMGSVIVGTTVHTIYATKSGGYFCHHSSPDEETIEVLPSMYAVEYLAESLGIELTDPSTELIAVRVPVSLLAKIDAKRGKYNRSEYIRKLIESALEKTT